MGEQSCRVDELEALISGVWARVLDRSQIDREASFEAIGGSSATMIAAAAEIEYLCGSHFPVAPLFFRYPTVSSLARYLSTRLDCPRPDGAAR